MGDDFKEARGELREWLTDLRALQPFIDPNDPTRAEFNEAFRVAFANAKHAAKEYERTVPWDDNE